MEGITFPFALVFTAAASGVYTALANKLFSNEIKAARVVVAASYVILTGMILELLMITALGVLTVHRVLGFSYNVIHLVVFFLAPPAAVNVLLHREWPKRHLYIVAILCWFLCLYCIAFNLFVVADKLYGFD